MLRNTENRTHSFNLPASMQVFFGKCHKKGIQTMPVVGRLVFEGSAYTHSGKEALLAVVGRDGSEPPFDDGRTVGIVRISDTCEESADLPCPSITLSALPRECGGRIALLDPQSERLFVSPDIVTVNRYAPLCCHSYAADARTSLTLPNGKRIDLCVISDSPSAHSESADGYILRPIEAEEGEEALYGVYRDVAEREVGQSVAAMLSVRREPEVAMRALMRAAVWGEVSMLLCDILTEGELMGALDRLHRVFCELEAEGREFNGYLTRGLCIDTPYLLSCATDLFGVDLFVYDVERIARLLCGEREVIPSELILKLRDDICEVAKVRRDIRHNVILGQRTLHSELCKGLAECDISGYVAPSECLDTLYGMLCEMMRE